MTLADARLARARGASTSRSRTDAIAPCFAQHLRLRHPDVPAAAAPDGDEGNHAARHAATLLSRLRRLVRRATGRQLPE